MLMSGIGLPVLANEFESLEEVETTASSIEMYRLYNPKSGEHFYTKESNEKDVLVSLGWKYEGIGWYAPSTSSTPVYRLYNDKAGDHHYTMDENEKNTLVRIGWKYEGAGWYSDSSKTIPLYRIYNPNAKQAGSHHYTTDQSERNTLVSSGWKNEGVAWYALKGGQLLPLASEPTPSPTPVDYSTAYRSILDEAKRIINEQGRGTNYRDDLFGILDAPSSSLSDIGYMIQDLSGDGIPELVIGFPEYGSVIALYTLVDNKPVNTFFGWSRSSYLYAGGSTFIYTGSAGAYNSITGLLSLSKDGQKQIYSEYYYTEPNSSHQDINTYLVSGPITVTGSSSGPTLPGGTSSKGKYIGGSEVASQKFQEIFSKKQSLSLTPLSQWK